MFTIKISHKPPISPGRDAVYMFTMIPAFSSKGSQFLRDSTSSVYSREPESPKGYLSGSLIPTILPTRHDLPEINSLDHQIALARGSTMALETTKSCLRSTKAQRRLPLSELKEQRLHQRNEQEYENQFYRSCFENFHELAMTTIESIQDLTLQYHFEPEACPAGNKHLRVMLEHLRNALERSKVQEARAEQEWKRQWGISRISKPVTRWL